MDLLSPLLSLFGIGRDEAERIAGLRIEASRLISEITAEAGQTLDLIASETRRLVARCHALGTEGEEAAEICRASMEQLKEQAAELEEMTRRLATDIENASSWAAWDRGVRQYHQMRATSLRIRPWLEGVIRQYDDALDRAGKSG